MRMNINGPMSRQKSSTVMWKTVFKKALFMIASPLV